jgi:hypothetical protein
MKTRIALLAALIAVTVSAGAAGLAGSNVLVPIAGRAAGAFGSQWQTDLVLTNLESEPVSLSLTFYGAGGERVSMTTTAWGRGTIVLEDVVWRVFGLNGATGMVRVSSGESQARFTARAYVVNRGSANGEYGQAVPGVPIDALATEHTLSGISADGRRTNLGVANPWAVPASVTLTMYGPAGQPLGQLHRIVPAFEVLQLSDAFGAFGAAPADEASVRVTSQVGVYAFASIVRNDSGDAIFVPGSGIGAQSPSPVAPACAEPASLVPAAADQQAAEGWIVMMQPETPVDYIRNVLPVQHGFEPSTVYDVLPGFAAELTHEQLASLRCDASVLFIQQNVVVPVP